METSALDVGSMTGKTEPASSAAQALETATVCGIGALLMFAVLSFGAVEEWSSFVLESGAVALFLMWAATQLVIGKVDVVANTLYGPMLLFAALIAVHALGVSAYPYASRVEALRYVAYGLIFFVSVQSLRTAQRRSTLLLVLTAFGFMVSLLGIAQHFTSPHRIYWTVEPQIAGSIFGPYVNHNHYAGLMELLIPIPILLSFNVSRSAVQRVLLVFAAGIMAASIFLSSSRGGMVAVVLQMSVLVLLLASGKRNRAAALRLGGLVLLVATVLFWLDTGSVSSRLLTLGTPLNQAVSGNRVTVAKDTLGMFLARPITGWGLATFPDVYPRYRSFATDVFINAAHNDYLQLMTECGLIGIGVMLWFLVALFRAALRSRRDRRWEDQDDRVPLAALVAIFGILVHSFTDFNLHIPANAALFYFMCALASTPVIETVSNRMHRRRLRETFAEVSEP